MKNKHLFIIGLTLAVLSLPHVACAPGINPWWVNIGQIFTMTAGPILVILSRNIYLLYCEAETWKEKVNVILCLLFIIAGFICLMIQFNSTESGAYFIQHILTPKD
jgi:hypothetical protein